MMPRTDVKGRCGTAKIGILTITDAEFEQAVRIFGAAENILGTTYNVSVVIDPPSYDIVLSQALDRTNTPAGNAAKDLMEDWRPGFIFLVGTAGGVLGGPEPPGREGTQLGDVIVADFIDYTEFRKLVDGQSAKRPIPHDHPSPYLRGSFVNPVRRAKLWAQAIDVARPGKLAANEPPAIPVVRMGGLVAGEKILSDWTNEYQQRLVAEYDKALAFETESFGVARQIFEYRNSIHYNPQFLTIRGISDFVDAKEANADRARWTAYAATSALVFAHHVADRLLAALALEAEPPSPK